MSLDLFPESFDPRRCILFLGAGFSHGAKNLENTGPPAAAALKDRIKELCELDSGVEAELMDMAEYAIRTKNKEKELRRLLHDLYTIKQVSSTHKEVLSHPWLRVYTTNYDNLASVYYASEKKKLDDLIFDVTDTYKRSIPEGAVIHLHGSISRLEEQNIDDSLVLSRSSYVAQRVKTTKWWDRFDSDIKGAQYIFFLGYDIGDFEVASNLLLYPTLKTRTHFFLTEQSNPILAEKIAQYGTRHSTKVEGFVELLSRAKVEKIPKHSNELRSFTFVDPTKDKKVPKEPTGAEIQDLFALGSFKFTSLQATIPESRYVVFRTDAIEEARAHLKHNPTLIIHGQLGNGKSIFIEQLKAQLSNDSFKCFVLRPNMEPHPQDIDYLKTLDAPIIFFEDYDSAISNMDKLRELRDRARFIVEIPTTTIETRMKEVQDRLLSPMRKICIDRLNAKDIENLENLVTTAGLSRLKNDHFLREEKLLKPGLHFRDFLLESYKEPEIAIRLRTVVEPLIRDPKMARVIFTSCILRADNVSADSRLLEEITGMDPYMELGKGGENASILMKITQDQIEPHSSILAEHILKKYIDPILLVDLLFEIAVASSFARATYFNINSEKQRRARSILSTALRFSFLYRIMNGMEGWSVQLERLYERCRRDVSIANEPLFWLQYSIFERHRLQWRIAEEYIQEAYSRAAVIPDYYTFQLDTQYLSLLCDIESLDANQHSPIERLETIEEMINACRKTIIDDGSRRHHTLKALTNIENFVEKRSNDFKETEAEGFVRNLQLALADVEQLEAIGNASIESQECRSALERSIRKLGR